MSTLKTTNLQHASAASPAIVLNSSGQATLNGLAFPTEGSLSGRNRIINGDMRIDQRNAGAAVTMNSSSTTAYCVDRFEARVQQASASITVQQSTTAPAGFTNSLLHTVTNATAPGSGNRVHTRQIIEGFNVADLGWGASGALTVTLSFWVRSSVIGTYGVGFINDAENRSYVGTYTVNAANTFEYKTITVPGDTSGTWVSNNGKGIRVTFDLGSGTSYNATANTWVAQEACRTSGCVNWQQNSGATFYITGVQLEAGSVATPFERRSYGQELALCQRYCLVDTNESTAYRWFAHGYCTSTTNAYVGRQFPVTMRVAPSITASGTWLVDGPTFGVTPTSITDTGFASRVTGRLTVAASSGYTSGAPVWLASDGTTNLRSITYSAEL